MEENEVNDYREKFLQDSNCIRFKNDIETAKNLAREIKARDDSNYVQISNSTTDVAVQGREGRVSTNNRSIKERKPASKSATESCDCGYCESGRTLYDTIKRKRSIWKVVAIIGSIVLFLLANAVNGYIFFGLVVWAIISFGTVASLKNELLYVCPCCHNDVGEEFQRDITREDRQYTARETYTGNISIDEKVVGRTYDVGYECPSCGHIWFLSESE